MKIIVLVLFGLFHTPDGAVTASQLSIALPPGSTAEDCETVASGITAKATEDDKVVAFGHTCAPVEASAVSHA